MIESNIKIIRRILSDYYWLQWKNPIRLLTFGKYRYGITIWKWSADYLPHINIHFGIDNSIGYDCFHNGSGFCLYTKWLVIQICVRGKIRWDMKPKGKFRVFVPKTKFEFIY